MFRTIGLLAFLATPLILPAQTIEMVGGTNTASSRATSSKGNLFEVTTSVYLFEFEMYLDVPGPETLTFFAYRHHSRSGLSTLAWTHPVQVAGGGGPAWYSTGQILLPLVNGNHYILGVSWPGTLTYHYNTATTGSPVSFGTWQRAHTISSPLPPTVTIPTGVDIAQYHQRLTTIPMTAVTNVGTGCASGVMPRLVATGQFSVNSNESIELVDAVPGVLGVFSIGLGPTLSTPIPLYGCSVWLPLSGPLASLAVITSNTGYAVLRFPVPNSPAAAGIQFSTQAGVLSAGIDITNAIDFQIQ